MTSAVTNERTAAGTGFIAIEGPIGVGKTSLARRLATTYQTELLLEEADGNPFLPKFYAEPTRYALATQLHFLFHRTRELQARRQGDLFAPRLTSDFLFEKDRLFARVVLENDEFQLYQEIYQRFVETLPRPSLVIYLQASVPTLQRRIARRGISYEQGMDERHVRRLLDVDNDRFLAAVEPDEIGALAFHGMVVVAREVALGALELDHAGAEIGEARGAEGRRDRLFQRDDQLALQGREHQ